MNDEAPVNHSHRTSRRPRVRSADVIVVLIVGALAVTAFNFTLTEIVSFLYNPYLGLLLLVMIVEFLWLKSGDRTRIYRLENDRLRNRRAGDEELLKRANQLLEEPLSPGSGGSPEWRRQAEDLRKDIEKRL